MAARTGASVLFLCTGNASRSVLAGAALARRRPDLAITTAGTLVVEGLPMSTRTRKAFVDAGLDVPAHRSRQATDAVLAASDLVIAAAPEHVAWIRREHPVHSARSATLIHLLRVLGPSDTPLAERVSKLDLAAHNPEPYEEIVDPGGGEVELYREVAHRIVSLIDDLAQRL